MVLAPFMPSVTTSSLSNGSNPKFALVSYIEPPLADFLDQLRRDLDPGCKPRAHVTLLPPRVLCSSQEKAAREIRTLARQFQPFEIRLGEISKFPVSNVIHIELASGRDRLLEMHRAMNCGASQFKEGYEYCPHVTIAQYLDPAVVDETFERRSPGVGRLSIRSQLYRGTIEFRTERRLCKLDRP